MRSRSQQGDLRVHAFELHPKEVLDLPRLSAPRVDPELPSTDIDRGVREIVRDGLSVHRVKVSELERLQPDVSRPATSLDSLSASGPCPTLPSASGGSLNYLSLAN